MTPRQSRMVLVALAVVTVAGGATLLLSAFQENIMYYVTPTEVLADPQKSARAFRLGGMVKEGSIRREAGSLKVRFVVTDFAKELPVDYTGVLPDLFREGQGVITHGKWIDTVFVADKVEAKHDENYMPPAIAEKMKAERSAQSAQPK
jgi:cytochrome c-type biogenesis protein CcmE